MPQAELRRAEDVDRAPEAPVLHHVDGVAGASAAQEYRRRHDARRERVTGVYPRMGRLLLTVFDDPQSTQAWSIGAVGEQQLAGMLAGRGPEPALGQLREKYPTGALATLRLPRGPWNALKPGACELLAFVRPRDLDRS